MSEEDGKVCNTCKYWLIWNDKRKTGYCHRHAPSPGHYNYLNAAIYGLESGACLSEEDVEACWPMTDSDDWCGEWQPKEVVE